MNQVLRIILLAVMLAVLAVLVPSPALVEGWTADPARMSPIPLDAAAGSEPLESGYLSDSVYEDATIRVQIQEDRYCDTPIYVARVRLADASQLRTVAAGRYGSQKVARAEVLADRANAVLTINGDYFTYRTLGLIVRQGRTWRYREDEAVDTLIVDTNGDLHAVLGLDQQTLDDAYQAMGGSVEEGGTILQAFTFGPALVVDGQRAHEVFVRSDHSEEKKAQRMVIAQDGPLSYVLVCCEGPDEADSQGLTIEEMAQYMLSLGVTTAYNLDGGGSTTMVFHGKTVNATNKLRSISDVICFCSALAQ